MVVSHERPNDVGWEMPWQTLSGAEKNKGKKDERQWHCSERHYNDRFRVTIQTPMVKDGLSPWLQFSYVVAGKSVEALLQR